MASMVACGMAAKAVELFQRGVEEAAANMINGGKP
jgi:hypothetical protein